MFCLKEQKLKELALRGDHLAEYHLGRYYLEERNLIDDSIFWLLKSRYGDPRYAAVLLNKLSSKYAIKIKKLEKSLKKELVAV